MPLNMGYATIEPLVKPDIEPGVNPEGKPEGKPEARQDMARTSRFISRTFQSGQGLLAYKLFIPASFSGHEPTLVVMLHGYGQSAEDFANGTDMNTHAEASGCLVMYPEQTTFGMPGGCWNWFDKAHRQRDQGDAALIAGATREVVGEFGVPADKVFVAGLSAGAAMAVVLGNAYPDLYCAVGCHSGLPHGCAGDTATALQVMRSGASMDNVEALTGGAVPVIVFHGDNDQTVHIANGQTVIEHSLSAACANDAQGPAAIREVGVSQGRDYTRVVHQSADGAVLAEHWVIHGAGHAWSGGNSRGSYADEKGPSASREMLRFFQDVRPVRYAAAA
jgi:poly(hydroxyalkanoate) depolymerase family esterase